MAFLRCAAFPAFLCFLSLDISFPSVASLRGENAEISACDTWCAVDGEVGLMTVSFALPRPSTVCFAMLSGVDLNLLLPMTDFYAPFA
jgi:hypothetical protein